jgi:geranylgeranyl reductase family protein
MEATVRRERDVEVIVVGGGPAGATAALELARQGRDVLVLERAVFPRDKPCGDCVNPGAVKELEALGLAGQLRERLTPMALRGWRIEAADGRWFRAEFGGGDEGWSVRRSEFDAALLDAALDAGARASFGARVFDLVFENGRAAGVVIRQGTEVRVLRARVIVGADGLRSVVQSRLGLGARPPILRKIAIVGHLKSANGTGEYGELRVRGRRTCGYAPFTGGANVTLVIPGEEARDLGGDAAAFLATALDDFPAVKARVSSAGLEQGVMVTGPFDRPVQRAWGPGAVLVGDAAGYYDPFTGQGIYQAIRSARMAASAIGALFDERCSEVIAFKRYGRELGRALAPTRTLQRAIEAAICRPALMSRFVGGLGRREDAAARLLRAAGDLAHPATLLDPRLWLRLLPALASDRYDR